MIYAHTPEARARLAYDILNECMEHRELCAAVERMLADPKINAKRAFSAGFMKGFLTALHFIETGGIHSIDPQSN
jgi:hypothetical protein